MNSVSKVNGTPKVNRREYYIIHYTISKIVVYMTPYSSETSLIHLLNSPTNLTLQGNVYIATGKSSSPFFKMVNEWR